MGPFGDDPREPGAGPFEERLVELLRLFLAKADVDFNLVLTKSGEMVELQGATEAAPFPRQRVVEVLDLAAGGMEVLFEAQQEALSNL